MPPMLPAPLQLPAVTSPELTLPFVFVPQGATPPADWLAAHPHYLRLPAQLRLNEAAEPAEAAGQEDVPRP